MTKNRHRILGRELRILIAAMVMMILFCVFCFMSSVDFYKQRSVQMEAINRSIDYNYKPLLHFAAFHGGSSHGVLKSSTQDICGNCSALYDGGSLTLSTNPNNGDTATIQGTTITFVTSGATGNQVNIGADNEATAVNLLAMLQASTDSNLIKYGYEALSTDGIRYGKIVTLTTTCNSGYVFSAWTGGGCESVGSNPVCTVTMFSNIAVTSTCVSQ